MSLCHPIPQSLVRGEPQAKDTAPQPRGARKTSWSVLCLDKSECRRNCILFLWATAPKLVEALEVMQFSGFTYKTHAVWDKVSLGLGYWFRGVHELLLVGTKGSPAPPPSHTRRRSIFVEKRRAHSQKPENVHDWIDRAFPDHRKIELFARRHRPGWVCIGKELEVHPQ